MIQYDICEYDLKHSKLVYVILDPENKNVYTILVTGPGYPTPLQNRTHYSLGRVYSSYLADSLKSYLQDNEDILNNIINSYQGTIFNGSNLVGNWSSDCPDFSINTEEISYKWDATSWVGGDPNSCIMDVLNFNTLQEWAMHESEKYSNYNLDPKDLEETIQCFIDEKLRYDVLDDSERKKLVSLISK